MKYYTFKIPIPEFKYIYYNIIYIFQKPIKKIYYAKLWCKILKRHLWKEYYGMEHWRKCLRCSYRELDHKGGYSPAEWHPTTYGTPEWVELPLRQA